MNKKLSLAERDLLYAAMKRRIGRAGLADHLGNACSPEHIFVHEDRNFTVVILGKSVDGSHVGQAKRNPIDEPNPLLGRMLALQRATDGWIARRRVQMVKDHDRTDRVASNIEAALSIVVGVPPYVPLVDENEDIPF